MIIFFAEISLGMAKSHLCIRRNGKRIHQPFIKQADIFQHM